MAAVPAARVLIAFRQPLVLQQSFRLVSLQLTSGCLSRRLCSSTNEPKRPLNPENESLLENLNLMGVDVRKARNRQPGVFRKTVTNEKVLAQFLQEKGASSEVIASIVSRYPRSITRSLENLEQRWQLLRHVFSTDAEIVDILDRSPESFFRSSDNENLEKNIAFLISLRLSSKIFLRLMTKAPRVFSNSVALNVQKVEFLKDICGQLGGTNPEQLAKNIICRNIYILIVSDRRMKSNINFLRDSLQLSNSALLDFLGGQGANLLDLSNVYVKKTFHNLVHKMSSLGCQKDEIKKLIIKYPRILYSGDTTLNTKVDCLLNGGITIKQILEKPRVLELSTQNLTKRLEQLQTVGYDFEENGIHILDTSQKRFDAKIEKFAVTKDKAK